MKDKMIINGVDIERLMETFNAVKNAPELGESHFRVKNRWKGGGLDQTSIQGFFAAGTEDTSRAEPFILDADEPPVLLGENRGPNPVEYLLTALTSCMTTSMVFHAAARGIYIDELESEVEGDIDIRGFAGIDKDVKKGFQKIRVNFKVKTDATPEQLKELALFSPVFDTITTAVPVTVNIETAQPQQRVHPEELVEANAI